jgi:hypothetical protein
MAIESDGGEWEYLASEVGGRRCLTIVDKAPPGWASPELREAWAIRREANVTGKAPRKPRRSRRGGMALPGRFLV